MDGAMLKRLEPLSNLAILFTCVLVCGFVLRDRWFPRASPVATLAAASNSSAQGRTPTPTPPQPLEDLGPSVTMVPLDSAQTSERVATMEGGAILSEQLEAVVRGRLLSARAQEYNIKRVALDQAIDKILLEREAEKRRLSIEDLARVEISSKVDAVPTSEIDAAYRTAGPRFANVPVEQARQIIGNELTQSRLTARRKVFVRELRDRAGLRVLMEPVRVDVDPGGGASRGPAGAPITIIEFSDFQCPFCARSQATLRQLEEKYPNKIRIVFRHFPLPIHKDAPVAAEAADCAADQGRFWQMHDLLFASKSFTTSDLSRMAKEAGANVETFTSCLTSGKHATDWRRHQKDGERYGVGSTPTFFVNGRSLVGAQPIETFMDVIDEELARADNAPRKKA